jgi:hypothetical protein
MAIQSATWIVGLVVSAVVGVIVASVILGYPAHSYSGFLGALDGALIFACVKFTMFR